MNIPTMRQLYDEFMHSAFREGKRIGLLKDGHYHVPRTLIASVCFAWAMNFKFLHISMFTCVILTTGHANPALAET